MKRFDSYFSWSVTAAVALLAATFGVAGPGIEISMKNDWKRIFAFKR